MKGWRTITVNAISACIAGGTMILDYIHVVEFPREVIIGAIIVVNIGNIYLRKITTTPVGKKS